MICDTLFFCAYVHFSASHPLFLLCISPILTFPTPISSRGYTPLKFNVVRNLSPPSVYFFVYSAYILRVSFVCVPTFLLMCLLLLPFSGQSCIVRNIRLFSHCILRVSKFRPTISARAHFPNTALSYSPFFSYL